MKKTSMALGSGGARGLAHIGILRALQDSGDYQISSIAGSSIGALVGGLYAAGKMDDYADWVSELSLGEIWKLLDFSYSRVGLFKGDRIMDRLAELVGDTQIDDLNMPFSAVATDIQKREEVWITQGSMFEAIRASIAIPGFFTPVRRNGRLLVDGGLLSPLPMTPLLYHDAEFNVVVSLNGNAHQPEPKKPVPDEAADPQDEPSNKLLQWFQQTRQSLGFENENQSNSNSVVDIFAQSVEAMQDRIARYQLAAFEPDLLIEVPVDACGILDFHRGKEMIDLGYELTQQALKNKG
ncbi:patatin-like phospholipase family protein [Saccharospirillum alexandrii]|uniref:patatin-like phospholipase family protein n=1 Tax=Saccharospirillum alexandrii TaxID=2448477 RepID=UPI001C6FDF81|nr:patatin-like phospholipase family protein [Saccharospirillum alexandrii]